MHYFSSFTYLGEKKRSDASSGIGGLKIIGIDSKSSSHMLVDWHIGNCFFEIKTSISFDTSKLFMFNLVLSVALVLYWSLLKIYTLWKVCSSILIQLIQQELLTMSYFPCIKDGWRSTPYLNVKLHQKVMCTIQIKKDSIVSLFLCDWRIK